MKIIVSFSAVIVLILLALVGVKAANLTLLFGIIIPYLALLAFTGGFIYRVVKWAASPVPFRIPTTCGQQESLPWIKQAKLENPTTTLGVVGRMALEILLFRSLFRNIKLDKRGDKMAFGSAKWLWVGALVFHWSFLIIILRHLRFFISSIPGFIQGLEGLDGFLQIGLPVLYITDLTIVAAITFLFLRRVAIPQVKYISQAADFFPLFLIFGIASTGIIMRYFLRVDIVKIKELAMGLVSLNPVLPEGIGTVFYIHLFLICCLFAYFPLSKLMHMGGVFLSPTRNLANNSRMARHINPWNYAVDVHSYAEYENDFRTKMKKAGLPVEME